MLQQGLKPNVITYIASGAGFWTWPPQGSQELDTFAESWVIAGKGQSGSEKGQSGSETVDRKVRMSESTGVLKAKEAWCEMPVCDKDIKEAGRGKEDEEIRCRLRQRG